MVREEEGAGRSGLVNGGVKSLQQHLKNKTGVEKFKAALDRHQGRL